MMYLKIGYRNLIKNKRRTILTMLTIIIGMCSLILANGFVKFSLWGLRESIINGGIGHFQIHKKGFMEHGDENPYDFMMTGYKKTVRELMRIPGIKLIAPRLKFQGIVSSADKSTVIFGTAGLSEEEGQLSTFSGIKEGQALKDEDTEGIMIGSGVAKSISGKAGDPCTVMITMKDGGVNALDFNISGVIQNQLQELDNVYVLANLNTIQKLLNTPGSIDTLVVLLTSTEDLPAAEIKIKETCEKLGLEYRRWDQLAPYYYGARDFYYSAMRIALIIIFAIVIFAVANTMSMSLFERIREIGTIRSIGTTRFMVMKIFVSESILLGIAGGIAGIIAGVAISQIINSAGGIQIPPPPGSAKGYQALINPDLADCLYYFLLFIGVSIIAVIYPALKAARMSIADALRWI